MYSLFWKITSVSLSVCYMSNIVLEIGGQNDGLVQFLFSLDKLDGNQVYENHWNVKLYIL